MLASDIADPMNPSDIPEAGAMAGAIFLREFVGGRPWIPLSASLNQRSHSLRPQPHSGMPLTRTGSRVSTWIPVPTVFECATDSLSASRM